MIERRLADEQARGELRKERLDGQRAPRRADPIAWDGACDNCAPRARFSRPTRKHTPTRSSRAIPAPSTPTEALRRAGTGARWACGVSSPGELIAAGRAYHLRGIACPTLVCEAESAPFWQGQPRQLDDALTCPKTFLRFTADGGAGEHCHAGAPTLFHQRAFDWLDDVLGSVRSPRRYARVTVPC